MQEGLEGFFAALSVADYKVVLAGIVDAVGEAELADLGIVAFAVMAGFTPVHRPLQEIEFATAEHLVAGIPQCLVHVWICRVHIVLVVLHGLGVVRRHRRHAGACR